MAFPRSLVGIRAATSVFTVKKGAPLFIYGCWDFTALASQAFVEAKYQGVESEIQVTIFFVFMDLPTVQPPTD